MLPPFIIYWLAKVCLSPLKSLFHILNGFSSACKDGALVSISIKKTGLIAQAFIKPAIKYANPSSGEGGAGCRSNN